MADDCIAPDSYAEDLKRLRAAEGIVVDEPSALTARLRALADAHDYTPIDSYARDLAARANQEAR